MPINLTDKLIAALDPPAKGNRIEYDRAVQGFGIRITANNARSFILNYWTGGKERRITIGPWPSWRTDSARKQATALRKQIAEGTDPMAEREAKGITIAQLVERYLEYEGTPAGDGQTRLSARSLVEYRAMLTNDVLPEIGRIKVEELKRGDVQRVFDKVSARAPVRANRVHSLIRRLMNLAIRWELRSAANPATMLERNAERSRERYLTGEELGKLLVAMNDKGVPPQSANVMRLALLTGARRGELLKATWDQFDLAEGIWSKPASTTKQRKFSRIPLNGAALVLLNEMKDEADRENGRRESDGLKPISWLFPGTAIDGPQTDLKHAWATVCRLAKIEELRFHDLRHAYASFLASSGQNLSIIGALLGHSNIGTTARYAHLLIDPLREATERVGQIVENAGRQTSAKVVTLRKA